MTSTTTRTDPSGSISITERAEDPLLDDLLDQELSWSPFARPPFISHFSMGLVAARRLGATDEELQSQFDGEATGGFTVRRDRPDWLAPDTARIERDGIAAEVSRRLPALLVSPDEQFFHAAIRLELAIDADHPGQVANALRTWEEGIAISEAAGNRFPSLDGAPVADPVAELRSQSLRAAGAFLASPNFGTLHLVTGTRALTVMLDYLDPTDQHRLARGTRSAMTARLADLGIEPESLTSAIDDGAVQAESIATTDWERLGRAALRSGDTHTKKLVYACRLQFAATGDPVFVEVADTQLR